MNPEAITTNLVKSIAVKVEDDETVGLALVKNEMDLEHQVKYEREVPEDNSADSLSYDTTIIIKTEENCDSVYGGRVTSNGGEFLLNDTAGVPPAMNGRVDQNMVGVTSFHHKPFSKHNGYLDTHNGDVQMEKGACYLNVQEVQSSVQSNGDFCECDVCGSFFCEETSNKVHGSANLCPPCRRAMESRPALTQQRVSSTSTSSPTGRHPCDLEWYGLYNFHVKVGVGSSSRNAYLYSPLLNKLYTTINSFIPMQFECEWAEPDLYVRALPVFLGEIAHPVVRCGYHMRPSEEMNAGFPYVDHVIRCNHDSCSYERDESSGRLSVVVPLGRPAPGCNFVTIMYKFMCKTSCQGGMERNPIQVIFTLERRGMDVVGRRSMNVRICSCPFRDMKKEEHRPQANSEEYKRKKNGQAAPDPCLLCKKPRVDEEQKATYIPVFGDKSVVKKAAALLRTSLVGEKLAAGEQLSADDHKNWKILNQIIADDAGPSVTQGGSRAADS